MKLSDGSREVQDSEVAIQWAREHCAAHFQPLAAWLAELVHDIAGAEWSSIRSASTFTNDLRMDELEPVELVFAIERELGIRIPDEDCALLATVADLIGYLNLRLSGGHACDHRVKPTAEQRDGGIPKLPLMLGFGMPGHAEMSSSIRPPRIARHNGKSRKPSWDQADLEIR